MTDSQKLWRGRPLGIGYREFHWSPCRIEGVGNHPGNKTSLARHLHILHMGSGLMRTLQETEMIAAVFCIHHQICLPTSCRIHSQTLVIADHFSSIHSQQYILLYPLRTSHKESQTTIRNRRFPNLEHHIGRWTKSLWGEHPQHSTHFLLLVQRPICLLKEPFFYILQILFFKQLHCCLGGRRTCPVLQKPHQSALRTKESRKLGFKDKRRR